MGEEQMGGNFAALGQRLGRIKTAIALGQPDRVPVHALAARDFAVVPQALAPLAQKAQRRRL